ncbi:MAG: hypothetical protein MHM6MM_007826 [Cercozoa sp. M6MM]
MMHPRVLKYGHTFVRRVQLRTRSSFDSLFAQKKNASAKKSAGEVAAESATKLDLSAYRELRSAVLKSAFLWTTSFGTAAFALMLSDFALTFSLDDIDTALDRLKNTKPKEGNEEAMQQLQERLENADTRLSRTLTTLEMNWLHSGTAYYVIASMCLALPLVFTRRGRALMETLFALPRDSLVQPVQKMAKAPSVPTPPATSNAQRRQQRLQQLQRHQQPE